MSNLPAVPFSEIRQMAEAITKSGLFGIKSPEQAIALMLIAQAEGRHPALAARDYDIIQGRPAKKSEAILRDYIEAGGKIQWHHLSDDLADASFTHPNGGEVRITWDMARAKQAGLGTKDMWRKYPRQMLRARVISEGVRTVCPSATSGMYVPEEVHDFDSKPIAVAAKTLLPKEELSKEKAEEPKEFVIENYEIPLGVHAGLKLKDKPKDFWLSYIQRVHMALENNLVAEHQVEPTKIMIDMIMNYCVTKE